MCLCESKNSGLKFSQIKPRRTVSIETHLECSIALILTKPIGGG